MSENLLAILYSLKSQLVRKKSKVSTIQMYNISQLFFEE